MIFTQIYLIILIDFAFEPCLIENYIIFLSKYKRKNNQKILKRNKTELLWKYEVFLRFLKYHGTFRVNSYNLHAIIATV